MQRTGLIVVLGLAACRGGDAPFPGPCSIDGTVRQEVGGVEFEDRTVVRYDDHGREVERITDFRRIVLEYDTAGHKTAAREYSRVPTIVTDAHGTRTEDPGLRSVERWSYEGDRLVRREWDRDADGTIDATDVHDYDADGRRIATHQRWDGQYGSERSYQYDERGRPIAELETGGGADERKTYDYDGDVLHRELVERVLDGRVTERHELRYDEHGRLVYDELHAMIDGGIHNRSIFERDRRGNVVRRLDDNPSVASMRPSEFAYDYACWTWKDDAWRVSPGDHAAEG